MDGHGWFDSHKQKAKRQTDFFSQSNDNLDSLSLFFRKKKKLCHC